MYLGIGKTLYNSSACLIRPGRDRAEVELALTERLLRRKASGAWPEAAIRAVVTGAEEVPFRVAENRDVIRPEEKESELDRTFPFLDYLRRGGLGAYSRHLDPRVEFVTHHYCHAMAAMLMSPFERCLIVVLDGAGTRAEDFQADDPEKSGFAPGAADGGERANEECTVYLHESGRLTPVYKRWRLFRPGRSQSGRIFSEGIGIVYEMAAEYIFRSNRAAGKVMGLAPLGRASKISGSRFEFIDSLDWSQAFAGASKAEWEGSGRINRYADLAATVQEVFEDEVLGTLEGLRRAFPDVDRLILTGGCALNCTTNAKLVASGLFSEIYVPPFPGDESIGLGAASHLYHRRGGHAWRALPHDAQHGYFGPHSSVPDEERTRALFAGFEIVRPGSVAAHAARILEQGHVVGWFQGRSESGPRALGNRSILARPDRPGIKDHLNARIKFREAFRPYGASCLHESAHEYFEVPEGFNTPYMAFASRTRAGLRERLGEVTHVDGTCRFQGVRRTQNGRFHELISELGRLTGLYCVLNTSLNVMGEPIVETLEDARNFLTKVPVHGMAVGDLYIKAPGSGV